MNYLAHAYLSFGHPEILFGNMTSDFIKGKKKFDYPLEIQKGIQLHRIIDTFTDEHPATRMAKEAFRKDYRLYSGAFVDVSYDYFLANDPNEFTNEGLLAFSQHVYAALEEFEQWMPPPFAGMFPYMKEHNWLYNYHTMEGISKSFGGVVRRAAYLTESLTATRLFKQHFQLLEECYRIFWADLKPFAETQFKLLI
jgi:acyl carrier protein phosphodiesterase